MSSVVLGDGGVNINISYRWWSRVVLGQYLISLVDQEDKGVKTGIYYPWLSRVTKWLTFNVS